MTVRAICLSAALACFTAPVATFAQEIEQAPQVRPKNVCESDTHFKDFDFWVGNWRVTDAITGAFQGVNKVEKVEGDCLIKEHWTNASGGTGFSINYYNAVTKQWRQVWVAAPGYIIDYTGGLNENGAMVLEGTIQQYAQNTSAPFRGTWTPHIDGTVRQFFEQYDPEKEEWIGWFDGVYTKIDEK